MSESPSSAPRAQTLSALRAKSAPRRARRNAAWLLLIVTAIVLLATLSGCATPAPPPCEPQPIPPPPVTVSPPPTETFSQSAAAMFKRWRDMLTSAASSDKP